jgi:hypothetical protein
MYVRMCVEGYRWPGCTRNIHYILSSKVNMFLQPVLISRGFPAGGRWAWDDDEMVFATGADARDVGELVLSFRHVF